MVFPETELLLREDHSFAPDAAHRFAAQDDTLAGVAIDDGRAFVCVRDDAALGEVRRSGDDRLRPCAVVDSRELELVGVRVLRELLHARRPDLVVPPRTLDALHFSAGHMEP